MRPAKYQPNRPSGSGEELVKSQVVKVPKIINPNS